MKKTKGKDLADFITIISISLHVFTVIVITLNEGFDIGIIIGTLFFFPVFAELILFIQMSSKSGIGHYYCLSVILYFVLIIIAIIRTVKKKN